VRHPRRRSGATCASVGRRRHRQVERHPAGARRGRDRHRRRQMSRVDSSFPRGAQGEAAGARPARVGPGERRVSSLPDGVEAAAAAASPPSSSRAGRSRRGTSSPRRTGSASPWCSPVRGSSGTNGEFVTESKPATRTAGPPSSRGGLRIYIATSRPRPRSGTRRSTSPPPRCWASHPPGNPLFVILAHTWGCCPSPASTPSGSTSSPPSPARLGRALVPARRALAAHDRAVRWGRLLAAARHLVSPPPGPSGTSPPSTRRCTRFLLSMALVTWLAVHWGDDEPGRTATGGSSSSPTSSRSRPPTT